jgi:exodeoxyribonuclease VII large subunit
MDYLIQEAISKARRRADAGGHLDRLMDRALADSRHRLELSAGSLAHLSPLARLSGGYGFVADSGGKAVRSVKDVREGDLLRVRLKDGLVETTAQKVIPD